ncbi:MAG: AraC family transcriptional regulator [Peptococcaceae bacterium BICA1-8]|nr:MAG: AraC family transcriptional regulator [Peptococcaceae bacterium BICA1-8]
MRQVYSSFAEKICFTDVEHTHVHNFGHLILPLQGALILQAEQKAMTVDHQHILLLPPKCQHTYYAKVRNEFLVFYIPYTMFPNNCIDETNHLELDARWRALRFLMLSECQNDKMNTAAINQLLHYSFQLMHQNQEYPSIRYIHQYYHTNISLEKLATLEHYHVSYYSQWFQRKMGVSLQTYIQKVRLHEAKRLLRETNYSLLDIAQQIGYEHQASLTRLFKQFEGITPSVYRHNSISK